MDIFYLCDGRACEKCHPETCKHTSDISHAKNFTGLYGAMWEEEPNIEFLGSEDKE